MTTISGNLHGLILAGGHSRRMGQDKALLVYGGKNQLVRATALLDPFCSQIFVSIRPDQTRQECYKHFPAILDHPKFSNIGPLGAILSAMTAYADVPWLIFACDLPCVNAATISCLVKGRDPQKMATAFISSFDGLPEPLCAIWESAAFEHILRLLNQGVKCPRKVLIQLGTCLLGQENPAWLSNVNTRQEYQQIVKNIK